MIGEADDMFDAAAWRAVLARDRAADGRFVTGVLSTGIYCRPSCAARHPKRRNVRFFSTPAEARAAGLRACLRCRPDDAAGDALAITRALALIARAEAPPSLAQMAAVAGYSPHHFHRMFRKATGLTPAAYGRGVRAQRLEAALAAGEDVTGTVYAAGYAAPARFYADADRRLGMTPGAWRRGGAGVTIRWLVASTCLGPLLIAVTDRGICRVAFDEEEATLRRRFPSAIILRGSQRWDSATRAIVARVPIARGNLQLPASLRRSVFQEAVRTELARAATRILAAADIPAPVVVGATVRGTSAGGSSPR